VLRLLLQPDCFFSPASGDVRDFFPVNTDILQNENFIFLMFPGDGTEWGDTFVVIVGFK